MVRIAPLFLANDNEFGWTKTISFSNHSCYIVGTFLDHSWKLITPIFVTTPKLRPCLRSFGLPHFPLWFFFQLTSDWQAQLARSIIAANSLVNAIAREGGVVVSCFWLGGGRQDLDRYPLRSWTARRNPLKNGWLVKLRSGFHIGFQGNLFRGLLLVNFGEG